MRDCYIDGQLSFKIRKTKNTSAMRRSLMNLSQRMTAATQQSPAVASRDALSRMSSGDGSMGSAEKKMPTIE